MNAGPNIASLAMPQRLAFAVEELKAGRPVLVADKQSRENEVDAIIAAGVATPEWVAWLIRYTSGYLCAPMYSQRADLLELPPMVHHSEDQRRTAYTITCDAAQGVSTGISAADRCTTLRVLANPEAVADDLIRPGHIVPLRAVAGGVLERGGHTEAAVDLCVMAGLEPVGVIGEMVNDDGSMMNLGQAEVFAEEEKLAVITIDEMKKWLIDNDVVADTTPTNRVRRTAEAELPTSHGHFRIIGYRDTNTGADHVALVPQQVENSAEVPLVRVHSECLTGEAFGSERCDCGSQLEVAMESIAREGGALVYLRGHEGRGIGLLEKIKAYDLQDNGFDTVNANTELGWPVDSREYGAAIAILQDLGLTTLRLATNSPDKIAQLGQKIDVTEVVPLEVGESKYNHKYLETKKKLMGHLLTLQDAE